MKGMLTILGFTALTFLCWGSYGPVLHVGQAAMEGDGLRPFMCVGLAYFLIGVVVPIAWLRMWGEKGHWTTRGTIWSLVAGAVTTIGALGIVMAFGSRGDPAYVMPLVFGGAPVVNTFVSMWMAGTYRQAGPVFFVGLVLVAVGAVVVLLNKPVTQNVAVETAESGEITVTVTSATHPQQWIASSLKDLETNPKLRKGYRLYLKSLSLTGTEALLIGLWISVTVVCWGAYGPLLHKGQMLMAGSRLRPLLCVGLAYFLIAVLVPYLIIQGSPEQGPSFNFTGVVWSLAAGAAGAIGAVGIILAFNSGGKPIYVMPLVFGGAPVVNTAISIIQASAYEQVGALFFVGLALVIAGAATVLVFAPKGAPKPAGAPVKAVSG